MILILVATGWCAVAETMMHYRQGMRTAENTQRAGRPQSLETLDKANVLKELLPNLEQMVETSFFTMILTCAGPAGRVGHS
jgi:hypothetical protein